MFLTVSFFPVSRRIHPYPPRFSLSRRTSPKFTFCALALLVGAAGCDSASNAADDNQPTGPQASLNADLASVTKAAAAALGDPSVASWIHTETMDQFDGETNVLWKTLNVDAPAGKAGSLPWTALLAKTGQFESSLASKSAGDLPTEIEAVIARASAELGGPVHLYWPNAEAWDGETAPLVAFTPVGPDLDLVTEIQGYDADGKAVTVTEDMAKARPVIIVTRNERVGADGAAAKGMTSANVTVGEPSAASSTTTPQGYFKLLTFKTTDDYEGWTQGSPEFRFKYARTTYQNNTLTQEGPMYLDPWGKQIGDCQNRGTTCTINHVFFDWRADLYRSYSFMWYEADGGSLNKKISYEAAFQVAGQLLGLPVNTVGYVGKLIDMFIDKEDDLIGNHMFHTDSAQPLYHSFGKVTITAEITPGGPTPVGPTSAVVASNGSVTAGR